MSLLNHHFAAGYGYDEWATNAGSRRLRDVEPGIAVVTHDVSDDVGAAMRAFRKALKAATATGNADTRRMGVYHIAMAAGRQGLGGFAPVAGGYAGPRRRVARAMVAGNVAELAVATGGAGFARTGDVTGSGGPRGEVGFARAGRTGGNTGSADVAPREGVGAEVPFQVVVAEARGDAAAGKARRVAERAALYLPARRTALTEGSFAPPQSRSAGGGVLLPPGARGVATMAVLHRRTCLSGSVPAVVVAPSPQSEVEEQQYEAMPQSAPAQLASLDMERALDDYFFRKSRLPPAGGAGFNPLLSPVWAGLKIPG